MRCFVLCRQSKPWNSQPISQGELGLSTTGDAGFHSCRRWQKSNQRYILFWPTCYTSGSKTRPQNQKIPPHLSLAPTSNRLPFLPSKDPGLYTKPFRSSISRRLKQSLSSFAATFGLPRCSGALANPGSGRHQWTQQQYSLLSSTYICFRGKYRHTPFRRWRKLPQWLLSWKHWKSGVPGLTVRYSLPMIAVGRPLSITAFFSISPILYGAWRCTASGPAFGTAECCSAIVRNWWIWTGSSDWKNSWRHPLPYLAPCSWRNGKPVHG